MNEKYILTVLLLLSAPGNSTGQANSGVIKERVYNSKTNEGVPFATVQIWGTTIGAVTDFDGNFMFTSIKPGYAEPRASSIGFKPFISSNILVTNSNPVNIDIPLEENTIGIDEVVIKTSPFLKKVLNFT